MVGCGAGLISGSTLAVVAGVVPALIVVGAYLMTVPLGRRVRRERLEFAWWLGHSSGRRDTASPNLPYVVHCFMQHRGKRPLRFDRIAPTVSGASMHEQLEGQVQIPPTERVRFELSLQSPAAGWAVLHGLNVRAVGTLGLFEVALYFPNPLRIRVLPRTVRAPKRRHQRGRSVLNQHGSSTSRRRGEGMELYEIRALQPGDPFRAIAWKPSARRGQLMVREVEQQVLETRWLFIDVGGGMRAGSPGSRLLDSALELAVGRARDAIDEGHRLGFALFDCRVLNKLQPDDDASVLLRLYDHLVDVMHPVDEDLTDINEKMLVAFVGRYLRKQDGIDFRVSGEWSLKHIARHVRRALEHDQRDHAKLPRARTLELALLRAFCRNRALQVPHREDPDPIRRSEALITALRSTLAANSGPSRIEVISSLGGFGLPGPLCAEVKRLSVHGSSVVFFVPSAPKARHGGDPSVDIDGRLEQMASGRRIQQWRTPLAQAGATLHG